MKKVIVRDAVFTFRSISILMSICFFAFLYVYQGIYILRAGYRIKEKEKKCEKLEQKILNLQVIISKIESPTFVKRRIREHGLKLEPCDEESVVRITYEKAQI